MEEKTVLIFIKKYFEVIQEEARAGDPDAAYLMCLYRSRFSDTCSTYMDMLKSAANKVAQRWQQQNLKAEQDPLYNHGW